LLRHRRDDNAVEASRAEQLPATKTGFAFHVLSAIDTGEFEVFLHTLPFVLYQYMRNSNGNLTRFFEKKWKIAVAGAQTYLALQQSNFVRKLCRISSSFSDEFNPDSESGARRFEVQGFVIS